MTTNAIFIGRFQPLHDGHVSVITQALCDFDLVHVLVGSANRCRSIKNPWTFAERKQCITDTIKDRLPDDFDRVNVIPLNDYLYSDGQWASDVLAFASAYDNSTLIGHTKAGNEYLKWFPGLKYKEYSSGISISATEIREQMRESILMPESVREDFRYYASEKQRFSSYPYPETLNFNCADALVECYGHVLLIQRKFAPGAGTWALPGGFKNSKETFMECAIRELFEETNLRVPEKVVRKSVHQTRLFDHPDRSFGIPRNTLCVHFKIDLNPDGKLPRANGCDDASDVRWVHIRDAIEQYDLYDDHKDIISAMSGINQTPAYFTTPAISTK